MKTLLTSTLTFFMIILLSGCGGKPPHHPKHPNYKIEKPSVKYKPSKKNLAKMVKQLQGSPYVWAEEGPNAFDCSGFTYYMYGSMGIELPRRARDQARVGKRVSSKQLQYGDLIFFATNRHKRRKITHVGMYLGNGWFTHASTVKHEVVYSNLFQSKYYKNRLRACRRYLPTTQKKRATPLPTATPWKKSQNIVKSTTTEQSKKAIVIQASESQLSQSSAKGSYYVQAGSFVGKPELVLMARIKSHNLHYKIISYPQNGVNVSKLLIGPYQERSQAETTLQEVRSTIEPKAFIAEIR